ncbi:ATP-binding protein [Streptomyces niveus]|uniref:ATP-binding protein n=1 Tax=Streptomyces niveus TaxID=193462 RepID=UPI0035E36593
MTSTSVLSRAASRHTHLDLTRHPGSCRAARHWASTAMAEWAYPTTAEGADDVLLVVSELVANSLQHATGPIRAHLARRTDGTLLVSVLDGGPAPGRRAAHPAGEADEHGRGLGIVAFLSTRHGRASATTRPYRTRSWATLTPR